MEKGLRRTIRIKFFASCHSLYSEQSKSADINYLHFSLAQVRAMVLALRERMAMGKTAFQALMDLPIEHLDSILNL